MLNSTLRVFACRVDTEDLRQQALGVLRETYRDEKRWVESESEVFPPQDLACRSVSWFLAYWRETPAGVLRVFYDPPLREYVQLNCFKVLVKGIDIEAFIRDNRIAEIGRFAVAPKYRRRIGVATSLMGAATKDTVARGYTHYVTDVFEGEVHSPYFFHTRVIGFEPIATHDVGEINCPNRRITLILNLKEAYQRLSASRNRTFDFLTAGWDELLHKKLAT